MSEISQQRAQGVFHTRQYGALGNGGDDTAALVQCMTEFSAAVAAMGSGKLIFDAPLSGAYNITAPLLLPPSSNWQVLGDGTVTINQHTDNTEIFKLLIPGGSTSNCGGFKIDGFRLVATNDQPDTATHSIGLAMGSTGNATEGIFNFELGHLEFFNLNRGWALAEETLTGGFSTAVWQWVVTKIEASNLAGAGIYIGGQGDGTTGCVLHSFYGQTPRNSEGAIVFLSCSGLIMGSIEINNGFNNSPQIEMIDCDGWEIGCLRWENMTFNVGSGALVIVAGSGKPGTIRQMVNVFANVTLPFTQAVGYFVSCNGCYVTVGSVFHESPRYTQGTLVLFESTTFTDPITSIVYTGRGSYGTPTPLTITDLSPGMVPDTWFSIATGLDIVDYAQTETVTWAFGNLVANLSNPSGPVTNMPNGLAGDSFVVTRNGSVQAVYGTLTQAAAGGTVVVAVEKFPLDPAAPSGLIDNGHAAVLIGLGNVSANILFDPNQPLVNGGNVTYPVSPGDILKTVIVTGTNLSSTGTAICSVNLWYD